MITWRIDMNVSCENVSLHWDIFREMIIHFSCLYLHAFWSFTCDGVHLAVFQWPIWGFLGCPQFYTWSNGEEIGKRIMRSLMFWRLELWCWGGEEYMLVQRWKDRVQKAVQLCPDPEAVNTDGTRCMGTHTSLLHCCKFTPLYLSSAVCFSQFSC